MFKKTKLERFIEEKGQIGESFVKWYCEIKNISYKKATYDENIMGIDAYLDNIPTDIKNSDGLVFGRYNLKEDKFYTRHPFRESSQSKNILILDIDLTKDVFKVVYNDSIDKYIIKEFLKEERHLSDFKEVLKAYSFKSFTDMKMKSVEHFLMCLKDELNLYLKTKAYIKFYMPSKDIEDCSIRLLKY